MNFLLMHVINLLQNTRKYSISDDEQKLISHVDMLASGGHRVTNEELILLMARGRIMV